MRILIDFGRDVAAGVRLLHRYRGFSAVAIVTLAAAIGGNAAVFTIVNALLLTPPPVAEPARLAVVYTGQSLTSWQTYEDVRDRADAFTAVSAHRMFSSSLARDGVPVRLRGLVTSSNYLDVLGVPAQRGRTYQERDVAVDGVVLAHHVWRQYFGADSDIVGQTVVLGGRSRVVIGVMPPGFRGLAPPGVKLDFWVPLDLRTEGDMLRNRASAQFEVVGRLRTGTGHDAATALLRGLAARLKAEHPELPESFLAIEARPVDGVHAFRGMASLLLPVFGFLAVLTVVSGFVLVIGCSNIAGLLLGRAAMRRREIAVRVSLGASRSRLLRQLLTESLVLAAAGGAAGLLLAAALIAVVRYSVASLPVPLELDLAIDRRVLAYVMGLTTATSAFFGLLPARRALRPDLVSSLKADTSGTPERQRLRRLLVAGQVAVCSALVIWSVLFVRSLGTIYTIQPGFEPAGVMVATVEFDRGAIDAARGDRIATDWTQRVAASPAVQSAAMATVVPLALTGREEFDVSLPSDAAGTRRRVVANRVSPGWFATVRVAMVAGRDFTWDDRMGAPDVAIVNETLARQFWNGGALGERVRVGDRTLEVVGIARDSKYLTLGETTRPLIYLPLRQGFLHFVNLYVRTADPRAAATAMTSEIQRLLPGTDARLEPMADAVAVAVIPAQVGAVVTGSFGLIAVALAACGVYGLVSACDARGPDGCAARHLGSEAWDSPAYLSRREGFTSNLAPHHGWRLAGAASARLSAASACAVARSMATAASPPTHAWSRLLPTTSCSFTSVWTSSSIRPNRSSGGRPSTMPTSVESRRRFVCSSASVMSPAGNGLASSRATSLRSRSNAA
jgi:predicted permease